MKNPQHIARHCPRLIPFLLLLRLFQYPADERSDAVIIGAGISGLSAALEAARSGAEVTVIDMSTVGGGHAILSNGAVCIVGTPLQDKNKITDSPDLARQDFLTRGQDANVEWVDRYVTQSRLWLYDWLTEKGIVFDALVRPPGNAVPRLHLTRGKGWGLVGPLFRESLRCPNIRFIWATQAEEILLQAGVVRGVRTRNLRTGKRADFRARQVIVATGGFQSNLERVQQNWPTDLPKPVRLLTGAAHTATGSGHGLVEKAGGTLTRLDHQWNYVLGLPDPRDPKSGRGLAAFNFNSIWVNTDGKRFTQEFGDPKTGLLELLRQPGGLYWSVFDENGKRGFSVTLAGWENFEEVSKLVYDTEGVAIRANSVDELAARIGLPPENLRATIDRYNQLITEGVDRDFQAFGPKTSPKPKKIETPPFYAVQFFPITRKSMGGVNVDQQCRVLSRDGKPIPGLYSVGEVTGFAGLNGKAALEGTFLGPAILMGRIVGKEITPSGKSKAVSLRELPTTTGEKTFDNSQCLRCHPVARNAQLVRPGFWHYEQSHAKVLTRNYTCSSCHSDLYPYRKTSHRMSYLTLTARCEICHGVQSSSSRSVH